MAVTYGFYNSLNGDRKYNSSHLNTLFDGIIVDGIFSTVYNAFAASVDTTNEQRVKIDTGKAWLKKTWTISDAVMNIGPFDPITVANRSRIDAVIIHVDSANRENSVGEIVKGVEATSPSKPELTDEQYPICFVTCTYNAGNAPNIGAEHIEYVVGQSDYRVPYVTAALQNFSIDEITSKWEAMFQEWFDGMKELPTDSAAYLNQRINDLIESGSGTLPDISTLSDNTLLYIQYEE